MHNFKFNSGRRIFLFVLIIMCFSAVFCISSAAADKKPRNISSCTVAQISSKIYTGKEIKPTVTVSYGKTKLKNGTHYTLSYSNNKNCGTATVKISGIAKSGYTGSKTVKFKIVPAAPSNLTASAQKNSVKLKWNAVKGASGYSVYSYDKAAKKYTLVASSRSTVATVKNLSSATGYAFAVRAYAKTDAKEVYGKLTKTANTLTKPGQVSLLQVQTGVKSASLTWGKVRGATGYQVFKYNPKTKKYTKLCTTSKTYASLSELSTCTSYYFAVRAYVKANGMVSYGAYSTATKSVTIPAKVYGVTATFRVSQDTYGGLSIVIRWNKVAGATKYKVYKIENGKYKLMKTTEKLSCSLPYSFEKYGEEQSFVVAAVYVEGGREYRGAFSDIVQTVSPPQHVNGLKVKTTTDSAVVTWKSCEKATCYRLYFFKNTLEQSIFIAETDKLSYTVTGLTPATKYKIGIVPVIKKDGKSYRALETTRTFATAPNAPKGLTAKNAGSKLTLSWSRTERATKYEVLTLKGDSFVHLAYCTGTSFTLRQPQSEAVFAVKAIFESGELESRSSLSAPITVTK